jgi:hypothetical protein
MSQQQQPAPQTANVQSNLPPTLGQNMPADHFGAYPTDPTNGIADMIKFFQGQADWRYLVHGSYDLVGYFLRITIGDPTEQVMDPQMMMHAMTDLQSAVMANPQRISALPSWILPLIQQAFTMLLNWWALQHPQTATMLTQAQAGPPQGVPPWLSNFMIVVLQWLNNLQSPKPPVPAPKPAP